MRLANNAALDLITTTAATIYNTGNLGTVPFRFPRTTLDATATALRRYTITNNSSTANVAVLLTTASSPTFTAPAAGTMNADAAMILRPLGQLLINVTSDIDVWAAASAISTPFQMLSYDTVA
jgi:hypothetical protein